MITDPNIPKAVRDFRQDLALGGSLISHAENTANTVATAAPGTAKSVHRIADAGAGIAEDAHKLTTDLTKPQPWYKKALSYVADGVKIGGATF